MSLNKVQKQMIDKLIIGLQAEGQFLRQDNTKSNEQKLEELDILLDVQKFLVNYEEATKILNDYLIEHKWEIKEKQSKFIDSTKEEKQID